MPGLSGTAARLDLPFDGKLYGSEVMPKSSLPPATSETTSYLPALRWHALTPAYDVVVRTSSGERRFKQRLVDHAQLAAGERVLDVGCGTGTLLAALGGRTSGLALAGVDRDPTMLSRAAARVVDLGAGLCVGDARRLPIATGSVDVVVSSLFFHHLLDDAKSVVLAEVRRVLAPSGRLVIADWGAPRSLGSRLGAAVVRTFDGEAPTRTNFAGGLVDCIADAGFESVCVVDRVGVPLGVIDMITATAPGELG